MSTIVEHTLPDLDLSQIARSGQCFSWVDLGGNCYGIAAAGHYIEAQQRGDHFQFSCDAQEFHHFWYDYFDLGADYGAIKQSIDPADCCLRSAAAYGAGIRILRQDLWEVMVSFLLSQNNNITRITRSLRLLRERWGQRCAAPGTAAGTYAAFPLPDELADATAGDFAAIGFGYRAKYLAVLVSGMKSGGLARLEEDLRRADREQAMERLLSLYGIGKKVANCICLFGLHHIDAFPIDTHIQKILDANYPDGFPYTRYQGYLGILQQYLFYYDLYHGLPC